MTKETTERKVTVDINGLVVESEFVNGAQIYATDKVSIDSLRVLTPAYTDIYGKDIEKKDIELVKITKWEKKYTKGSSDIILSQTGGLMLGMPAFRNMCEAISRMPHTV